MILRIVQFFFGCSHFAVCEHPGFALVSVQQCQLRAFHKGLHVYPRPWVEQPRLSLADVEE